MELILYIQLYNRNKIIHSIRIGWYTIVIGVISFFQTTNGKSPHPCLLNSSYHDTYNIPASPFSPIVSVLRIYPLGRVLKPAGMGAVAERHRITGISLASSPIITVYKNQSG